MSRKRYLSTDISIDKAVNRLAVQAGDFAALLYTWMIPHARDDGTLTGDPEELILMVIPGRRDKNESDIIVALTAMNDIGLILWDNTERIVRFPESFFKHQKYISQARKEECERSSQKVAKVPESCENLKLSQKVAILAENHARANRAESSFSSLSSSSFSSSSKVLPPVVVQSAREDAPPPPRENANLQKDIRTYFAELAAQPDFSDCFSGIQAHQMADAFFDNWEAVSWMVRGAPITNWKAKARQWACNQRRFAEEDSRSNGHSTAPPLDPNSPECVAWRKVLDAASRPKHVFDAKQNKGRPNPDYGRVQDPVITAVIARLGGFDKAIRGIDNGEPGNNCAKADFCKAFAEIAPNDGERGGQS